MTDISNAKFGSTVGKEYRAQRLRFEVQETHWGYIVSPTEGPRFALQFTQALAMIAGAGCAAAALGLMILPEFLTGNSDLLFRAVAAIVFGGAALLLLWYASRGTQIEYQFDTSLGEIRETVRNRAGRSSKLGCYGFDAIGGVHIDRSDANPKNAALVLRFGNTSQTATVASGTAAQLEALKDRLGQDLIIGKGQYV